MVQWSEVPGHTGLLYCMTQTTNNPVVLMIKPDSLLIQEIKVVPAKAKIQDVVAIRHNASNSDQVSGELGNDIVKSIIFVDIPSFAVLLKKGHHTILTLKMVKSSLQTHTSYLKLTFVDGCKSLKDIVLSKTVW